MIFQQVYGFGPATITIQGAPNETVTYTGKESGTVTLDSNGDASLTVKAGTYSFAGSVSSESQVTRANIRVKNGNTVTMWPDNSRMVYWFGRVGVDDSSNPFTYGRVKSVGTFVPEGSGWVGSDYLRIAVEKAKGSDHSDHNIRIKLYFTAIDTTEYSSLHGVVSEMYGSAGTPRRYLGLSSTNTSGSGTMVAQTSNISSDGVYSCDITSANSSYYPCVFCDQNESYSARRTVGLDLNALWLE